MSSKTNVRNLKQLGNDLLKVYSELREGEIDGKTAEALANVAGKIIGSVKVVVDYTALAGKIDQINMVDGDGNLEDAKKATYRIKST